MVARCIISTQAAGKELCTCAEFSVPLNKPMIPSSLLDRPWQKLGADLFYFKDSTYLLVVDYFLRYPEIVKLQTLTAQSVINWLKNVFHGTEYQRNC